MYLDGSGVLVKSCAIRRVELKWLCNGYSLLLGGFFKLHFFKKRLGYFRASAGLSCICFVRNFCVF